MLSLWTKLFTIIYGWAIHNSIEFEIFVNRVLTYYLGMTIFHTLTAATFSTLFITDAHSKTFEYEVANQLYYTQRFVSLPRLFTLLNRKQKT